MADEQFVLEATPAFEIIQEKAEEWGVQLFTPLKFPLRSLYWISCNLFSTTLDKFRTIVLNQLRKSNPNIEGLWQVHMNSEDDIVKYLHENATPNYTIRDETRNCDAKLFLLEFETIEGTQASNYITVAGFITYDKKYFGYPEYNRFFASDCFTFDCRYDFETHVPDNNMVIISLPQTYTMDEVIYHNEEWPNLKIQLEENYNKNKRELEEAKRMCTEHKPLIVTKSSMPKLDLVINKEKPNASTPLTEHEMQEIRECKNKIDTEFKKNKDAHYKITSPEYYKIESIAKMHGVKLEKREIRPPITMSSEKLIELIESKRVGNQQKNSVPPPPKQDNSVPPPPKQDKSIPPPPKQDKSIPPPPKQEHVIDQSTLNLARVYYGCRTPMFLELLFKASAKYGVSKEEIEECTSYDKFVKLLGSKQI